MHKSAVRGSSGNMIRTSVIMPPRLDEESATERMQLVAPKSWMDRVEEWRRKQPRIPSKSEAIRILVDIALRQGGKD